MNVELKSNNPDLQISEDDSSDQLDFFRGGLVQVSRIGQGVDTELDILLESLRKSICEPDDDNFDTPAILAAVEERQDTLNLKRTQFASKSAEAMRSLMEKFEFSNVKSEELDHLVVAINANRFSMLELPELLHELAQFGTSLKDEKSISKSNLKTVLKQKAEILLAQLSIPESLKSEYSKLQKQLEATSSIFDINQFFDELSRFLIDLLTTEQSNLNQYLTKQNTPISVIDSLLQESDTQLQTFRKVHLQFSKSQNSEFDVIRHTLETTEEINELKEKLTKEVDKLSREFSDFSDEHSVIENSLIEKYQKMKNQFDELQKNHEFAVEKLEVYRAKSLTDSLTELPNRLAWKNQLKLEWERAERYGSQLSLAVVDIDYFKKINDAHGHLVGDNVLRAISMQLRKYIRSTDFLSRFGGEEFTILLPETKMQDAVLALDKVREKISNSRFYFRNKLVKVSVSIGVSEYRKGDSQDQLFNRADKAMYAAKDAGRNQVNAEIN